MAAKAKFASLGSMRKPPSWKSSAFGASISLVHQQPFVQFNSIGTPATICTSQFNWYTSNICTSQFKSIQLVHVSNHLILVCLFLKVFPSRALARNFPRRGVPAPFLRSSKISYHNVAISRRMCFHNSAFLNHLLFLSYNFANGNGRHLVVFTQHKIHGKVYAEAKLHTVLGEI